MAVFSGANVVNSGLVFAFDAGADANFGATISTNKYGTTTTFLYGTGSSFEAGSNPTNTIVLLENPSNYSPYVLRQNGNNTEYQINLTTQLASSTTYVLSGWYAKSSDYNADDTMFHCRAFSTSGNHVALGVGIGTEIKSQVVGGITWSYRYTTITTPSDYSNQFDWYVGYGTNNTAGYRYYANLRLEEGTFPTLKDLKSNSYHTTPLNGTTYSTSNGGAIIFDGTNDYLQAPSFNFDSANEFTLEAFVKFNSLSGGQSIIKKNTSNDFWPIFQLYTSGANIGGYYSSAVYGACLEGADTTNSPLSINTWYQLAFSKGTAGYTSMKLYINGTSVSYTNFLYGSHVNTLANSSKPIHMGRNFDSPNWIQHLNGSLASVRCYNRQLTDAEILQNFNAQKDRFGI